MLSVRNVYRLVVLIPAVILGCTSSGLPIGAQCGADSDCSVYFAVVSGAVLLAGAGVGIGGVCGGFVGGLFGV